MALDQKLSPYTFNIPTLSLDPAFAVNGCMGVTARLREQLQNELAERIRVGIELLEQPRRGYLRLWHVPPLARVHTASTRQKSSISGWH
jgi:hypothetical protein